MPAAWPPSSHVRRRAGQPRSGSRLRTTVVRTRVGGGSVGSPCGPRGRGKRAGRGGRGLWGSRRTFVPPSPPPVPSSASGSTSWCTAHQTIHSSAMIGIFRTSMSQMKPHVICASYPGARPRVQGCPRPARGRSTPAGGGGAPAGPGAGRGLARLGARGGLAGLARGLLLGDVLGRGCPLRRRLGGGRRGGRGALRRRGRVPRGGVDDGAQRGAG